MGITADFSGAVRKTKTLAACMPEFKRQATKWSSETVRDLQKSAASMQKAMLNHHGRHTSQMQRNIGQVIQASGQGFHIVIGSGLRGTLESKYARIQDEGGITHPTVTPKMRAWAWAMYRKWKEDKYKGIALTPKDKLTVHVPASNWFTSVIERREPILHEMMDPEVVYNLASQRAGGKG